MYPVVGFFPTEDLPGKWQLKASRCNHFQKTPWKEPCSESLSMKQLDYELEISIAW